jgi:hypothetical protein
MIKFVPVFWDNSQNLQADLLQSFCSVQWNLFLSVQAYYLMLLFIFVAFKELVSKIGKKKAKELFFG